MSYTIHRHVQYNLWANKQIVKVLKPLDDAAFYTELKSSFSSIAKTVLHMRDADIVWTKRLQGTNLRQWPSETFTGDKAAILEGFIQASEELCTLVLSLDNNFLQSTLSYKSMAGAPFENHVDELLFHAVNHASYHRGQIATMLRELGGKPVATDLIVYLRLPT
jgi:uncharacterized damage-inducible protein DinB